MKAVRYGSLDEARQALREALGCRDLLDLFDDDGEEPQGLLSVIPEDRLSEEDFVRLFSLDKGILVEVERVPYSGYGPPAEEDDYMGFVSKRTAYILAGCGLPVDIEDCPFGAVDIHHLEAMILDGEHPFDGARLARRLGLPDGWSFDTLFDAIAAGHLTAEEVDRAIHSEQMEGGGGRSK
jgi:hypothetical protein